MMSDPRNCNKCDRKMGKGELFYNNKNYEDYDLCMDCYDKKSRKGVLCEEDFQLMTYCLPPGTHNVILIIVIIIKKIILYRK